MDEDLDSLTREQLRAEAGRLRAAIREHRDASGQDLCWHHPKLWSLLPRAFATLGAASVFPAAAISVSASAVADTVFVAFAVFALLLFLVVYGLVAAASRKQSRPAQLRRTLVWFPAAAALAALALFALRLARSYASFDAAAVACALLLTAVGIALVVLALVSSRRDGR